MDEVKGKLEIFDSYPDDGVEGSIWVDENDLNEILKKYKDKNVKIIIEEIQG